MNKKLRLILILMVLLYCAALISAVFCGRPWPVWNYDRLTNPVMVEDMEGNTFLLSDGRRYSYPQIAYFPTNSVFRQVVASGVEISGDGRIYGLIDVDHRVHGDKLNFERKKVDVLTVAIITDPGCVGKTGWRSKNQDLLDRLHFGESV